MGRSGPSLRAGHRPDAGVAQLVEQLIRNQQVIGSSPIAGSRFSRQFEVFAKHERIHRRFDSQLDSHRKKWRTTADGR
jgi:hypothetical protein